MRNIDQLAARQEQITGEMTKLQEGERQILHKNSESPPSRLLLWHAIPCRGRKYH
jgi:predicted metal-dependent hydrolase